MRYYGVLLCLVGLVFGTSEAVAQTVEPFTLADIVRLLREEVPQPRIAMLVADRCVERGDADDVQAVLEAAGAESALLRVARAFSCVEEVDPAGEEDQSEEAGQDDGTSIVKQEVPEDPTPPPGLGIGFGEQDFVLIQPGSFLMGSEDGGDGERPQHAVTITQQFYMQRTPVTQMQWRAVMGTNPSEFRDCGDTCPVEQVGWDDAQDFIQRLNELYPGRNYRLPTEAEWEYAARAGATGAFGGTEIVDEMGWYRGNSDGQTHPVALKRPNAWGLYDMLGNVWEWVEDRYGPYTAGHKVDPIGAASGATRVLRGGSWSSAPENVRATNRDQGLPTLGYQGYGVGFRLVRSP